MPEIKSTFLQGKMNKDLDERLIPNGQYRDANNVDVSISESSNVGTVQNILGNSRAEGIVPTNCTCVGSVVDENSNKLYWFVKSSNREAIVQYDEVSGESVFVAVDMSSEDASYPSFLKFTGNPITGINIVDNFLFWTDGDSEPKKINVEKTINQDNPSSIDFHTILRINGEAVGPNDIPTFLSEEHVTVVRRKPSIAPSFRINSSSETNLSPIFEKIFPRFCFRYKYRDGEYSAFSPFTNVVFNPEYVGSINEFNAYNIEEPYNKAMVNSIKSIDLYNFVPSDIPDDVVQVDLLYKQENSNVVYSIANIKYSDPEWTLGGYSQDVDGSSTIHKGKYTVTTENVHAALPENQLFRPWDNVPKTALAQEVTGNRLVYANYKQGYNFQETPKLSAGIKLRPSQDFGQGGLPSLKSLRDYQMGVVFGDEYGRETPVFTSPEASVKIGWTDDSLGNNASNSLMFTSQLIDSPPDWVDYYKFYVKQTSGEYYNLIMDKAYLPQSHTGFENKGDHAWISFASADRNKLVEDDFIIVKKVITAEPEQISYNNRYKILDIKNEAPEAIKYVFSDMGVVTNAITGSNVDILAGGEDSLFEDQSTNRIDSETDMIHINRDVWTSSTIGAALLATEEAPTQDAKIYLSWKKDGSHSDRYEALSVTDGEDSIYKIKLKKKISSQDAELANGDTAETLADDLQFKIERKNDRAPEDFSGKFFVKVKRDVSIIQGLGTGEDAQVFVQASQEALWLFGNHNGVGDYNEANGIVNSSDTSTQPNEWPSEDLETVVGKADTPEEWSSILNELEQNQPGRRFFIDNMPFVSSNPSSSFYAKESGEGWAGANTRYENFVWGERQNLPLNDFWEGFYEDAAEAEGIDEINLLGDYTWRFGQTISQEEAAEIGAQGGGQAEIETGGLLPSHWFYATPSGYGLAPRPILPLQNELEGQTTLINGLEGIVTSSVAHTAGPRRWLDSSIYDGFQFAVDQTYGTEQGKYFIHLSFLAPGVDLHTGFGADEGLPGVELQGPDSIASQLQGIFGGGIFTKTPNSTTLQTSGLNLPVDLNGETLSIDSGIYPTELFWVEFEGNYNDEGVGLESPPSLSAGQGYGTSAIHTAKHDGQWDPSYLGDGFDAVVNDFIEKLSAEGNRFRFSGDPNNEEYEILSVAKKKLYNHTSWRKRWVWNGDTQTYISGNNSVEEAAISWAGHFGEGTPAETDAADVLKQKIVDFGAAHNRRICYVIEVDKDVSQFWDPTALGDGAVDMNTSTAIEFVTNEPPALTTEILTHPAIWETEPQQLADLNIYYEASESIPTKISDGYREVFAPAGCRLDYDGLSTYLVLPSGQSSPVGTPYLAKWQPDGDGRRFTVTPGLRKFDSFDNEINYNGVTVKFFRNNGSYTTAEIQDLPAEEYNLEEYTDTVNGVAYKTSFLIDADSGVNQEVGLSWYNCFSFGDGVESNRIRDKFNDMQINNGARASATLEEPYSEEHRKYGLIYSGIYNSNSGVNNLNQFIQAEKITKDLNPTYGSIQKLFSRNTDLVALCEDRILRILANKDALFNADGNPQVVAVENVLGQAVPFVGDYGISKNPESFASESYRAYFADKQRGAVLRLSMDGLTPISDAGMRDYFRDTINSNVDVLGSYDDYSKQYNLTVKPVSFENIIKNSTVQLGAESEEFFNLESLLGNSNLDTGLEFNSNFEITEDNFLNGTDTNSIQVVKNWMFESQTYIYNHSEIPAGSIAPYVPAVDFEPAGASMQVLNTLDGYYVFADDFTNNNSLTTIFGGSLDGTPRATSFPRASVYNLSDNIWEVISPEPYMQVNEDSILAFQKLVKYKPGEYSISSPEIWALSSTPGFSSNPEQSWNSYVPTGVLESSIYSNYTPALTNNTIFNGEEIRVYFKVGQHAPNQLVQFSSCKIKVELFDGTTPISQVMGVSVHDPGFDNSAANYFTSTHAPTVFQQEDMLVDDNVGFQGGSSVDLGIPSETFPIAGSELTHNNHGKVIYFKFTNGTENHDIVAHRLVVRISVLTGDARDTSTINPKNVYLDDLSITKSFYLHAISEGQEAVPEQLQEPLETIPAWASVYHVVPDHWQSTPNVVQLNHGNVLLYGHETEPLTQVTAYNGNTYQFGQGNGVVEYNEYPGPEAAITYPNADVFVTAGQSNGYLSQDIAEDPFVVGNWYLLDVEFKGTGSFNSDDVRLYGVVPYSYQSIYGQSHTSGDPLYPQGWFGEITGTSGYNEIKSLKLMPADDDAVYPPLQPLHKRVRGVFQLLPGCFANGVSDSNGYSGNLNTLRIEFEGSTLHIVRVALVDVTNQSTGGNVFNWQIDQSNYTPVNAVELPEVYYANGMVNWNTTHKAGRELSQNISDFSASENGYKLSFDILPNFDLPLNWQLYGKLDGRVNGLLTASGGYNKLDFNGLYQPGSYEIFFNFYGGGTIPQPEITLDGEPYQGLVNFGYGTPISGVDDPNNASKITFEPHEEGEGFIGAIDNIYLTDTTEYFTASSIADWNINNVEEFDNYVQWQDGAIVFEDAPTSEVDYLTPTTGSNLGIPYISQNIGDIPTGTNMELSFNFSAEAGDKVKVCYFNSEGAGFEYIAVSSSVQTLTYYLSHEVVGTVYPENPLAQLGMFGIPINTLVIRPWGPGPAMSNPLNGSVDNISLKKTLNIESQTISFNEDVKGWVSFKSFIPESGLSLSSKYFTMHEGGLWEHNTNSVRGEFYGTKHDASITTVLNTSPSSVKNFNTINYEGSQAYVPVYSTTNSASLYMHNTVEQEGWKVEGIYTDLQDGTIDEFIEKEGKWFNYIRGLQSTRDVSDFNFQGIGIVESTQ
tara:strand:+ start:3157 stop:11571 length:8415 start_codon:yes stop_codon:yes gene_type:complete